MPDFIWHPWNKWRRLEGVSPQAELTSESRWRWNLEEIRAAFPWQEGDVSIYQWIVIFCRRNWSTRLAAHNLATRLSMSALTMHNATQVDEWMEFVRRNNYLFMKPYLSKDLDKILVLLEDTLRAIIHGSEEPYCWYIREEHIPLCGGHQPDVGSGWVTLQVPSQSYEVGLPNPPLRGYQTVFIYMYSLFKHARLNSHNAKDLAKLVISAWDAAGMKTDRNMEAFVRANQPFERGFFSRPVRLITNMIRDTVKKADDLNIQRPLDLRAFTTDQVVHLVLENTLGGRSCSTRTG